MDLLSIKFELLNFAEEYKAQMSANVYEHIGRMVQSIDHDIEEENKVMNNG